MMGAKEYGVRALLYDVRIILFFLVVVVVVVWVGV